MTEQVETKGLSKGCLIGLIVVGVLVVMLVIGGVVCYTYRADIVKFGIKTMLEGVKVKLAEGTVEGVDAVAVSAVIDSFVVRIDESETDEAKMGMLAQVISGVVQDDQVDSAEVALLMSSMADIYPDLQELLPEPEAQQDTLSTEE